MYLKRPPKYAYAQALKQPPGSVHCSLGMDTQACAKCLGHASITMTFDRYGHLFEDRDGDKEAMKKLEAAVAAA